MLIQDFLLGSLRVQVYSIQQMEREQLRILVFWKGSLGIVQVDVPAGKSSPEREALIDRIAAAAIREVCADLREEAED